MIWHIDWYIFTDVAADHIVSILKVKQSKKNWTAWTWR